MKKLLWIVVLSLLIASSSFATTTPLFDLWKFFNHGEMVKILSYNSGAYPNEFISIKDGSYKKSPERKKEKH